MTACRSLKSLAELVRMLHHYRPFISVAGWWLSLMNLSGPEPSINFGSLLPVAEDGILLRLYLSDFRLHMI